MNQDHIRALGGLVFVVPATVLCTCGLAGISPPADVVHPVLVVGGLAAAIELNLTRIVRLRAARRDGRFIGLAAVQFRGKTPNLVMTGVALALAGIIAGYLFVENVLAR